MDSEFILNDALNKALITDRITNINSNTIAIFVTEYLKKGIVECRLMVLLALTKR